MTTINEYRIVFTNRNLNQTERIIIHTTTVDQALSMAINRLELTEAFLTSFEISIAKTDTTETN